MFKGILINIQVFPFTLINIHLAFPCLFLILNKLMFHIILRQSNFFRGARCYTVRNKETVLGAWIREQEYPGELNNFAREGSRSRKETILKKNWKLKFLLLFDLLTWTMKWTWYVWSSQYKSIKVSSTRRKNWIASMTSGKIFGIADKDPWLPRHSKPKHTCGGSWIIFFAILISSLKVEFQARSTKTSWIYAHRKLGLSRKCVGCSFCFCCLSRAYQSPN